MNIFVNTLDKMFSRNWEQLVFLNRPFVEFENKINILEVYTNNIKT